MQVLHFAATTGTGMQAKVGATGFDTLGRFSVNLGDRALLKVVFPAMHIGTDQFKRQGPFNEYHLAVSLMGNALGFYVKRLNGKPVRGIWQL